MKNNKLINEMKDFIRRQAINILKIKTPPPYEYVQTDAIENLFKYLKKDVETVTTILTVGAHLGFEVESFLDIYPNVNFKLFEASPRYFEQLTNKFKNSKRVQTFNCAIADKTGFIEFKETNLAGSGSILNVGRMAADSYGMKQSESYTVQSVTLDGHAEKNGYQEKEIDNLWIDVQGAEMMVLSGAEKVLKNTKSIFIEISTRGPLYENGATFGEIYDTLTKNGFIIASLGTDHLNGTGNAFFIRP